MQRNMPEIPSEIITNNTTTNTSWAVDRYLVEMKSVIPKTPAKLVNPTPREC